jgi:hypothetical protein
MTSPSIHVQRNHGVFAPGGFHETWTMGIVGYTAIGVIILGSTVRVLTFFIRRVRFARFNSKSGHAGLDIGSAGNDMAVFDDFVKQVRRQILKA